MALLPDPRYPLDGTIELLSTAAQAGYSLPAGADIWNDWRQWLSWTEDVEKILRERFTGFRIERLHTERFWQAQSLMSTSPRAPALLRAERDLAAGWLASLAEALKREEERHAPFRGVPIAVADTSALLPPHHFFVDVDWCGVVGETGQVRLAIPLRVIDELDVKKTSDTRKVADRAASVIRRLRGTFGEQIGPVPLRDGVTIEIARVLDVDPSEPYTSPGSAETEIIDTCESLTVFAGSKITLVTGDLGMQVRAAARDVLTAVMPDDPRAEQGDGTPG